MVSCKLTEKKMQNKRFRKTEEAILAACYQLSDFPNAKKLACRAKISRSTFHRHHKSPWQIPYNYQKYLLKCFDAKIKSLSDCQEITLKVLYLRMLIFIHSNREVIKILLSSGHADVMEKMISKFKKHTLEQWNMSGNLGKVYDVYRKEILGIIENWSKQNFLKKELDTVLNDILYLTKTAPRRLSRLITKVD